VEISDIQTMDQRVRGKVTYNGEEGWISLKNTENGDMWVELEEAAAVQPAPELPPAAALAQDATASQEQAAAEESSQAQTEDIS